MTNEIINNILDVAERKWVESQGDDYTHTDEVEVVEIEKWRLEKIINEGLNKLNERIEDLENIIMERNERE